MSAQAFDFKCDPVEQKYGEITVDHEITSVRRLNGTNYYRFVLIVESTKATVTATNVYVRDNFNKLVNNDNFQTPWFPSFRVGQIVRVYLHDPEIQEEGDYRQIGEFIIRS